MSPETGVKSVEGTVHQHFQQHKGKISCQDCLSLKLAHSLISWESIIPTENIDDAYLYQLKNKIENDGKWTHPIIVEKSTNFLLDGHHRYHAAKLLGMEYIPCVFIGYDSKYVDVYCTKTNKLLDKNWLLSRYNESPLLPYKYTKHVFHHKIPETDIDIDLLLFNLENYKVIKFPYEINYSNIYTEIDFLVPARIFLKNEGLNISGSIKHKPALKMVCDLENKYGGNLDLVESSSGNLGVALSMICISRGHTFTCVHMCH